MKVLLGIDGSDHSLAAAALAGRLLTPGRDQVAFYHSCTPASFSEQVDESLHERACRAVADVIFEEAKTRLPMPLQSDLQTIVGEGRIAEGLLEAADRFGAELIVVGARGLGRMEGLLVGSVSSSVVRSSPVPVLVVRTPDGPADAGEFRILMGYDQVNAKQHADSLGKLAWPANAQGRVVAVIDSLLPSHLPLWVQKRARDADTQAMSQTWVQEHRQEREAKEQELAAYVEQLPAPFRANPPIVAEGNPAEQLIAQVDREKPSIIVVGKAMKTLLDRWFVGSVSEKVLSHAKCSVLVIPAQRG